MSRPFSYGASSSSSSWSGGLGFENWNCPFHKLGLPYGATRMEVSRAFRQKVARLHPDKADAADVGAKEAFQKWVDIKDEALALAAPDLSPEEMARTQAWTAERERRRQREALAKKQAQEKEERERKKREEEQAQALQRERERTEKEHVWLAAQAAQRAKHAMVMEAHPTEKGKEQVKGWSQWMLRMLYGDGYDNTTTTGNRCQAAAGEKDNSSTPPPPPPADAQQGNAQGAEDEQDDDYDEVQWLRGVAAGGGVGGGGGGRRSGDGCTAMGGSGGDPWSRPRSTPTIDEQRAAYLARKQREEMRMAAAGPRRSR